MRIARLLVDDSAASDEGIRLLKEAGIEFQLIPANGISMPVLLVSDDWPGFAGLGQIRLYLNMLQKHQKGIYD